MQPGMKKSVWEILRHKQLVIFKVYMNRSKFCRLLNALLLHILFTFTYTINVFSNISNILLLVAQSSAGDCCISLLPNLCYCTLYESMLQAFCFSCIYLPVPERLLLKRNLQCFGNLLGNQTLFKLLILNTGFLLKMSMPLSNYF